MTDEKTPWLVKLDEAMESWWKTGTRDNASIPMCIALYCIATSVAGIERSLKCLVSIHRREEVEHLTDTYLVEND